MTSLTEWEVVMLGFGVLTLLVCVMFYIAYRIDKWYARESDQTFNMWRGIRVDVEDDHLPHGDVPRVPRDVD